MFQCPCLVIQTNYSFTSIFFHIIASCTQMTSDLGIAVSKVILLVILHKTCQSILWTSYISIVCCLSCQTGFFLSLSYSVVWPHKWDLTEVFCFVSCCPRTPLVGCLLGMVSSNLVLVGNVFNETRAGVFLRLCEPLPSFLDVASLDAVTLFVLHLNLN